MKVYKIDDDVFEFRNSVGDVLKKITGSLDLPDDAIEVFISERVDGRNPSSLSNDEFKEIIKFASNPRVEVVDERS